MQDMVKIVRDAIANDPRSLYQFARDCGLSYAVLHRFVTGEREGITIKTLAVLAHELGLELRPAEPKRRKGGA